MKMALQKEFDCGQMNVKILASREDVGKAAAESIADSIRTLVHRNGQVRMIFASAPSQNEVLYALRRAEGLNWSMVTAFQMVEYLGLPEDSPQLLGNYLKQHIFDQLPFKQVHYLNPNPKEPVEECERYSSLINEAPIDIVCMGIGENGHIAFNGPPVANFSDPKTVKVVELDEPCRQEQVNNGCFKKISEVPTQAMTLTVPTVMAAEQLRIVASGEANAAAVRNSLSGQITINCPASTLRTHLDAVLYLDPESASKLKAR